MPSPSDSLQTAVYQALLADPGVAAIVGDRIYDPRPVDSAFPCLSFGPSDYVPRDSDCILAREETLQIDCWTRDGPLWRARSLADAVKVALHERDLDLSVHALARIEVAAVRVFMDEDGLTGHGVVTVEAEIEER